MEVKVEGEEYLKGVIYMAPSTTTFHLRNIVCSLDLPRTALPPGGRRLILTYISVPDLQRVLAVIQCSLFAGDTSKIMGLSMDRQAYEIHVPSGPTSSGAALADNLTLPQLITRKDNLEAELKALGSVLDSHGVNMNTTLTTFDGYPRDDVDVAQIRVTRARIISLRNDWKGIMDRIEKGLHQQFEDMKKNGTTDTTSNQTPARSVPSTVDTSAEAAPATPFARVNSVENGSPAHEAGLKAEDLIRSFGGANWMNHERLRKVGEVVQRNLGRPILVKIVRGSGSQAQELQLMVTPRAGWGGRGTLGCHVVPI